MIFFFKYAMNEYIYFDILGTSVLCVSYQPIQSSTYKLRQLVCRTKKNTIDSHVPLDFILSY